MDSGLGSFEQLSFLLAFPEPEADLLFVMRYLTVTADYQGTGVKDDFDGPVMPGSLGLSEELIGRISK